MSNGDRINNSSDILGAAAHPIAQPDATAGVAPSQTEKHGEKDLEVGQIEGHHSSSSTSSTLSGAGDDDDSISHDDCDDSLHHRDTTPPVTRISTNVSLGPDNPVEHYTSFVEVPDSVYDQFSGHRKTVIVTLLSYCAFLAPISSTTVLSATPEVAAEFHTSGSIVNVTNALYMLFMGISPIFWGPFSEVWGRKHVSAFDHGLPVASITVQMVDDVHQITCLAAVLFTTCSIGTALSPNLAAFFVFRILTAFEGTAFLLVGSACLQYVSQPALTLQSTIQGEQACW